MQRLAITGLGAVTRNIHLPAYALCAGRIELVGGCDIDSGSRARFATARPGVPVFADFAEMVEKARPDVVAICTPPSLHHRQCLDALAAGCHVFCEKPLVESLLEADELIDAAIAAERLVVVNSQFPLMKIHTAAKAVIGTEEFGRLLFLHASQTFRPTTETEGVWRSQMARRLGFEFGVHVFELARYFFGEEPLRLMAHMPNPVGGTSDVINVVSMEFSGGRAATILLDRLCKGPERYLDLRLDGENAAIRTSIGGELRFEVGLHTRERKPFAVFHFAKGGKAVIEDGNRARTLATDGLNPFAPATAAQLGGLLDAIANGSEPAGSARDHRRTLELVFAAYESAETRAWVELNPTAE